MKPKLDHEQQCINHSVKSTLNALLWSYMCIQVGIDLLKPNPLQSLNFWGYPPKTLCIHLLTPKPVKSLNFWGYLLKILGIHLVTRNHSNSSGLDLYGWWEIHGRDITITMNKISIPDLWILWHPSIKIMLFWLSQSGDWINDASSSLW